MDYVEQCPHCGGVIVEKAVKEVIHSGTNTAFLTVTAGVCLHCGERLYTPALIKRFEQVEVQLKHQDTRTFQKVGETFQVVA